MEVNRPGFGGGHSDRHDACDRTQHRRTDHLLDAHLPLAASSSGQSPFPSEPIHRGAARKFCRFLTDPFRKHQRTTRALAISGRLNNDGPSADRVRRVPWRVSARRIAVVAFAAVVILTLSSCGSGARKALRPSEHPNIVFVLTDDLDLASMPYMPNVRRLLADRGVTFTHYMVSNSLCCPSRSSILRGQYAHNTGVQSNGGENGGFETAYRLGIEKSTIGTWLHDAGYRTAYIGKYLNLYPDGAPPTYVPPGWDEFDSASAGNPYSEYEYALNENGHSVIYGARPEDYGTFVYIRKAQQFIQTSAGKSFFLYLNVYPPHQPATPAPQDRSLFPDAQAPRIPTFNRVEPGKPKWLSRRRPLDKAAIDAIDALYRDRIRSLQAVDRGVGQLIDTLKATGQLANTYFIFSSDNGFHLGEFRMPAGKGAPYDSDIRVPLIVRGPGIPASRTSDFMIGNIDLAPTLAQLAHEPSPPLVDGRSFASLLHHPSIELHPRHAYLLEHWQASRTQNTPSGAGPNEPRDLDNTAHEKGLPPQPPEFIPEYHGIRTDRYLYVEYSDTSRELYATDTDPYEIHNLVLEPRYASLVARLHTLVGTLSQCHAAACRALEDTPIRRP